MFRALGNFLCISYCFNTARQVARKLPCLKVRLKQTQKLSHLNDYYYFVFEWQIILQD